LLKGDELHWDTTIPTERSAHMSGTVQISFYDEKLKKDVEGSFISDGKSIHVFSPYGAKSFPYNDLGACIDYNAQVSFVKTVLSGLARDPSSTKFKDLQHQLGTEPHGRKESHSMWGSRS
jgi:hypothetical protein